MPSLNRRGAYLADVSLIRLGDTAGVELLRLVDELALNAWPAPVCQQVGGWVLRYGWGTTRRANSAWPCAGPCDLDVQIGATLRAYQAWGAPARVQVTEGLVPGLDERLADLGWTSEGACHVMAASVTDIVDRTPDGTDVELATTPDTDWIEAWWTAGRGGEPPDAAARIVGLPLPAAAHARRSANGRWLSVGRGVVERGWVGIFAVATNPDCRGHGHGTAVLGQIARWASGVGAQHAYLQVEVENTRAERLFSRLGFERLGSYHYRTLVDASTPSSVIASPSVQRAEGFRS